MAPRQRLPAAWCIEQCACSGGVPPLYASGSMVSTFGRRAPLIARVHFMTTLDALCTNMGY
jgi:hypothetical protein